MNRRDMMKSSLLIGLVVLLFAFSIKALAQRHPTGGVFDPPSPPVSPFLEELRLMPVKAALSSVDELLLPENGGVLPNGTVYPQVTGSDALTTYMNSLERIVAQQQRNSGNNIQFSPKLFYVLNARQARHIFHPAPPYNNNGGSIIWGYDGIYPGPTFISRYGKPILVRIINGLYFDEEANPSTPGQRIPGGFGNPRISTHLHNGHTASESDGNPTDFYPPAKPPGHLPQYPASILKLTFRDHHYAMFRPGLNPRVPANMPPPNKDEGDIRESVCTLWYHDHSMDFTGENVYKGLVGFHLLFDDIDSGNEKDISPCALRLPSGEFDIPLLIQDKRFDSNGQLFLPDLLEEELPPGVLGDRFVVNGQIQPKLKVLKRKYRFRLLNAGPSRFYEFFLTKKDAVTNKDVDYEFFQIGNDESLLEKRVKVKSVLISVAERADIVIDFRSFNKGDMVYLVNRLVMKDDGFGPVVAETDPTTGKFIKYKTLPPGEGDQILCFEVGEDVSEDPSKVPRKLRANPALPPDLFDETTGELKPPDGLKELPNHRTFVFGIDEDLGISWAINKRPFNSSPAGSAPAGVLPTVRLRLPGDDFDGEVWTIVNDKGEWAHPVHIHLEEFRILWRDGKDPPATEQTKKDVLRLDPGQEVQIFVRFRDFLGKYPIHCHNVIHEDHAMMLRFDVVGDY